jgi:hypothetical protein
METKRRDDLLIGPREKAIEAVNAGNKEDAIKYINELNFAFQPTHDRFAEFIQALLVFVSEKLGEEAVNEALTAVYNNVYKKRVMANAGWKPKETTVEELAGFWCRANRDHWNEFYVEEDDEKFTVVITHCGSGGKMHDARIPGETAKAYPWSYNQAGVNYFCCHEPVFEACAAAAGLPTEEQHEYQTIYNDEGKPVGHLCKRVAYKKK